jgi:hypothetical protein
MFNLGVYGGTIGVYNNTFICSTANGNPGGIFLGQQPGGTTTPTFKNNLIVNCQQFADTYAGSSGWDYNVYSTASGSSGWVNNSFQNKQCYCNTLTSWQTDFGQDANAHYTGGAANLGGSYENGSESPVPGIVPQSNSVAVGAGANLTGLGIAALALDITGAPRAQNGNCTPGTPGCWDAGALQYSSGTPPPNPPTGLTAQVQ